jgi:hypothetical protein
VIRDITLANHGNAIEEDKNWSLEDLLLGSGVHLLGWTTSSRSFANQFHVLCSPQAATDITVVPF